MRVAAHITLFGAAQAAKTGDHLAVQIGGSRLPWDGGRSPTSAHRIAGQGSSFCGRDRVTALVVPARRATMRAIRLVPCWSSRLDGTSLQPGQVFLPAAGITGSPVAGQGTPGRRRALAGPGRCFGLSPPRERPDGV